MRCQSCNCILSDREATRRDLSSDMFTDLCDRCLEPIHKDVRTYESVRFIEDSNEGTPSEIESS